MSEKPKAEPRRSEAGDRAIEEREARLAAALRANLRRRKAQARERAPTLPDEPETSV